MGAGAAFTAAGEKKGVGSLFTGAREIVLFR
jgi:hypothetical protein